MKCTSQKRPSALLRYLGAALVASGWLFCSPTPEVRSEEVAGTALEEVASSPPSSVAEARARARLLHETVHGALQVMHRDFFQDDDSSLIPSHSLEDVFRELARSHSVQLRWLVVNANAMNVDNNPRTPFEKSAVKALAAGKTAFEAATPNSYQYVGSIRLSSQCLKCHVPRRTSTEDRAAGLLITMPLKSQSGE